MMAEYQQYHNMDLRFDGPLPEDAGWPIQLKLALAAVLVSMAAWVGAVVGSWLFSYYQPAEIAADYGPVSFVSPAPIADSFGVAPQVDDLPIPSINVAEQGIPVSLTRVVDCAYFACAEDSIPVLVDIRYVRVGVDGQEITSFTLIDDYKTTYEEGDDYILDTTKIVTNTLAPFEFPKELVDDLLEEDANVTAWRIEGTTTVDRPDAIPASWRSEVFHASLGLED